jgi:hypothetical protein
MLAQASSRVVSTTEGAEMEILFILTALTCFVFGLLGIIISLIELTKFVLVIRKTNRLDRRKANAHLGEFFHVLSIAICLILVSLLDVK